MDRLAFIIDHRKADLPPKGPLPAQMAREIVWSRPMSGELTPSRLIEDLFMVAAGLRPSSMFHPKGEPEVMAVHDIAMRAGIGMAVRLAGSRVHKVFLFGQEREPFARKLPDITEDMGREPFIIAQIALANMTGQFLGFPSCCVDSFVKHLMAGTDQDQEAMEALRGHGAPDPRAYFVDRFVPCRPDCPEAITEGERIEGALSKKTPDLLVEYRRLRDEHVEEVRSGAIVREKRVRDRSLL